MLNLLIKPLLNLGGDVVKGVIESKRLKSEQKLTKIKAETELLNKQISGEVEWDIQAIKQAESSWKDEWLTILFSIPLILCFCGEWGRQIVTDGFLALSGMPTWYQVSLGSIVAASFATRSAKKFFNPIGKKK